MPAKRTYGDLGDACRAANALDLVGDRWSLIVVRELILGPKRFVDLQEAVRGITPAVLTDRLRALTRAGIVEQITLPDLARTRAYAATDWGRGLEPVLQALGRWFSSGPEPDTVGAMTPDAVVIAMRTKAPAEPGGIPTIALRLYDCRRPEPVTFDYRVGAAAGPLVVATGAPESPLATVTAESTQWSRVLFGGLSLARAERARTVHIAGDRNAAKRVVSLYRSLSNIDAR